jgi:hypothetical protein
MIPENFVACLSSELDPVLVKDLLDEYRVIRRNHSIGDYEKALIQAGKFCETVFQILEYITSGVASKEPEISEIAKTLERLPKDKFQDSIRIIMPLAARTIYSIRSKRGTAHKRQEISPCHMDSAFVLSTCDWILSELVRLYYTGDQAEIVAIISSLGEQEIPVIEKVDNHLVVARPGIIERLMKIDREEFAPIYNLTGRDRYLLILKIAKSKGIDGLTPVEIESVLKERLMMKGIHVSNIRRDLRNSGRFVGRFPFGRGYAYVITSAGEDHLKNVQSKSK